MEALATARALLWRHERASYELEDCQHVAALISSGVLPSRIVLALTGAYRDGYWRRRGVHFRDLRRNLEHWCANAKAEHGKAPRSGDKGEAIERWRRAFALLPVGLKIGRDKDPDFTVMPKEQIDLLASDMEAEIVTLETQRRERLAAKRREKLALGEKS